jgi:hypothetical protein
VVHPRIIVISYRSLLPFHVLRKKKKSVLNIPSSFSFLFSPKTEFFIYNILQDSLDLGYLERATRLAALAVLRLSSELFGYATRRIMFVNTTP